MTYRNEGGSAFPTPAISQNSGTGETTVHQSDGGMSLRDYFAAKAMQGICTHQDTCGLGLEEIGPKAYAIADLMLKARA